MEQFLKLDSYDYEVSLKNLTVTRAYLILERCYFWSQFVVILTRNLEEAGTSLRFSLDFWLGFLEISFVSFSGPIFHEVPPAHAIDVMNDSIL